MYIDGYTNNYTLSLLITLAMAPMFTGGRKVLVIILDSRVCQMHKHTYTDKGMMVIGQPTIQSLVYKTL